MESQDNTYLNLQLQQEKGINFQFFMDSFCIFINNVVLNSFFEKNWYIFLSFEFWERNLVWLATRIFPGFNDVLYVYASDVLPSRNLWFSSEGKIPIMGLIKK